MKVKKVIIIVVSVALVGGLIGGGIYGYKSYQGNKLVAEVQPVSNINWGYWGDSETSYGMVTNDSSQEIYLDDSGKIEEVYVQKGDEVKEGDALIKYDTSEIEIEIKRKRLELGTIENNIAVANRALEVLKQTTPVVKDRPKIDLSMFGVKGDTEDIEDIEDLEELLPEKDEKDDRIYNYVTGDSVPYNVDTADGSAENPYIFYCNKGVYAYGSFYNALRPEKSGESGKYALFIICKKDSSGKMVTAMPEDTESVEMDPTEAAEDTEDAKERRPGGTEVPVADDDVSPNTILIDGNSLPTVYDDDRMWYIFSGEEVGDALGDLYDSILEDQDWEEPEGYTKEELAEAITEKEEELKKLDISRRTAELNLQSLEDTASDGVVYAKLDGVVKSVLDSESGKDSGQPFMVVTGDEGLYVSGTISELLLDEVKPGTVITANSWESGNTFEATVTEISDYPVSGNSWGDGNPNVSYYQYTAYIEDSSALKNGEYVDLSIKTNQSESGGLYIEKAYVRQEDGKSYVMIADENDRLKKQYVVTGKTVYGSAVEIKSGLSESDLIAFPYGKTAVEGVPVTEESDFYY